MYHSIYWIVLHKKKAVKKWLLYSWAVYNFFFFSYMTSGIAHLICNHSRKNNCFLNIIPTPLLIVIYILTQSLIILLSTHPFIGQFLTIHFFNFIFSSYYFLLTLTVHFQYIFSVNVGNFQPSWYFTSAVYRNIHFIPDLSININLQSKKPS